MALINCVCEHEFQDRKYGKGIRVANPCSPSGMGGKKQQGKNYSQYRCTVCGREH